MSSSVTGRRSSGSITCSSASRIASRLGPTRLRLAKMSHVTWGGLVLRNLLRRPVRTALTAAGVSLGVGLIVALLSITNGAKRTAGQLIHIGRADFGLFQAGTADLTQ